MRTKDLQELLTREALTPSDINSIYYLIVQTTPRVARALSLLLMIDARRAVRKLAKNRKTRTPRRREIGAKIVKPGLGF